jgi:hypothetical protein
MARKITNLAEFNHIQKEAVKIEWLYCGARRVLSMALEVLLEVT